MPQSPWKTIAILGGTGSFGTAMTDFLLAHTAATIRIISRDENKQAAMKQRLLSYTDRLRFMLGDIRDLHRLNMALFGVDLVIAAAALKYVDGGEYDPGEFVKTNIYGTENVIHACINNDVQRAIFLSSDKAVRSLNLYGNSKAVSEKLWIRGNGYAPTGTAFVALRYGNVLESRGSVIPKWRECLAHNLPLLITDLRMTRFMITLAEAVQVAWFAAEHAPRGGIIIPHLPAYNMKDMLAAFCKEMGVTEPQTQQILVRPGERFHEELVAPDEEKRLTGVPDKQTQYYCVQPMLPTWQMSYGEYSDAWVSWQLPAQYCSEAWPYRLSVADLRQRLRESNV